MYKVIFSFSFLFLLVSCASIFQSVAAPNKCKKCEIINVQNMEVLKTLEGCGGSNTYLERDAKVEAFDMVQGFGLCDLKIDCVTWTQEIQE